MGKVDCALRAAAAVRKHLQPITPPSPPDNFVALRAKVVLQSCPKHGKSIGMSAYLFTAAMTRSPALVDKEAAVLIQARNSAAAAWLWRKFAASTPLAGNAIRIDPWCGVMGEENAGGE